MGVSRERENAHPTAHVHPLLVACILGPGGNPAKMLPIMHGVAGKAGYTKARYQAGEVMADVASVANIFIFPKVVDGMG